MPPVVVPGRVAPERTCEKLSVKFARLALNAVVLTFAMLLPMTSIRVWLFRRPDTAENSERSMSLKSYECVYGHSGAYAPVVDELEPVEPEVGVVGANSVAKLSSLVLMFINCSTLENCASCAARSFPSIGFIGSWFCISVTSNLTNWSFPIAPPAAFVIALLAEPDEEFGAFVSRIGAMPLVGAVIISVFLPAALYESAVGSHPRPVGCPGD